MAQQRESGGDYFAAYGFNSASLGQNWNGAYTGLVATSGNLYLPFIYTDAFDIGPAKATVTIAATDAYAETANPLDPSAAAPGEFTFSRGEGNTNPGETDLYGDLIVYYQVNQNAQNGEVAVDPGLATPGNPDNYSINNGWLATRDSLVVDTTNDTGWVIIPFGQSSVTVTIVPVDNGARMG